MKENIILVDFIPEADWEFKKALERATGVDWQMKSCVSNRFHGSRLAVLRRYFLYFWMPLQICRERGRYDRVLAWQQFYGLIPAFYFRLFARKQTPKLYVMTFIYKPKKGLTGRIYEAFMRYIVTSGYISRFFVFSQHEADAYAAHFGVAKELFCAERLGIEDRAADMPQEKGMNFLAPGRSNRDYTFLQKAWAKDAPPLEIICDCMQAEDAVQDNIRILTDCHGSAYLEKLRDCRAVCIPLGDAEVSSGQLVILQAFMFSKPVIITRNAALEGYVTDGYDGLIIDKDEGALQNAVEKLADKDFYDMLSVHARESFEQKFTIEAMGLRIGKALCGQEQPC